MNIPEAIEDLQTRVDGEFSIEGVDDCEDMKLGIEALEFLAQWERDHDGAKLVILPSETEE